ncbi:prolipoprotein diacylglyceryl transferase family protein [Cellulomonas sp. 73-92]|uniref:prolipoprotein diacylglyceryl transferase family protein n=1 Tax=Cellulomonas sp. 73-92 TaxID=1895740 RepID=UPI000A515902|nr:prolipoprotein diacylglyceryl transferase family protein [Cellulomonas sp. 73-92]
MPDQSLAELLGLAAARTTSPATTAARTTPAPAAPPRPPARPAPVPAAPIAVPTLAKIAGSPNPATGLEFVTTPFRALADLEPQAVAVSYWFTPPAGPNPYQVAIRFTGHRLDVAGPRTPADDFVLTSEVSDVAPASGPIVVTQRTAGTAAGRWSVTAEAQANPQRAAGSTPVRLPPAAGTGQSVYAPIAAMRAPGVLIGSWPAMVALGFLLGLLVQGLLARVHTLPTGPVLTLSLLAGALGLAGAKTYYRLTHRHEPRTTWLAGLSVQGFVVAATAVFILGGWWWGVPIGHLLDASIPALLTGQAVGRLGCLFAGCCNGLPTRSRWAIWSSDRRVGTRRIPVQLLESSSAALLALLTGLIAWRTPPQQAGYLFLGGLAAYVIVRQVLFPLRGLARVTRHGRAVMLVLAPLALAAAVLVPALT